MDYIRLSPENLESEHICCAISNAKDPQVIAKKRWLAERLVEGLVFLKADARGKCFIEYIPAENAWAPIDAPGYMFIDCLWVSGSFKGHGYSNDLLNECIRDSRKKGKSGLCILSSAKKRGFLVDPKYLKYKGFIKADSAKPYFELMYLPFDPSAPAPRFREQAKSAQTDGSGFEIFYTSQCPFTAKYVPLIENMANDMNLPLSAVHISSREQAQNAPCAYTAFSLFYNGKFITHEIPSEKKFAAICEEFVK